jgi:hypothetical protein
VTIGRFLTVEKLPLSHSLLLLKTSFGPLLGG